MESAMEAVLGLQWGDEGKGKVVDERAAGAAAVVRFQGGANAGHTLSVEGEPFALHQVPSGALRPDVVCVIGAGCVVDPVGLRDEVEALRGRGHALDPGRLVVSPRAQVVLPWMRRIDAAEEALRDAQPIGTTRRGVGPAYAAKAGRWGVTAGALAHGGVAALQRNRAWTVRWLGALGLGAPHASELEALELAAEWLTPYLRDDLAAIDAAAARGRVILEGQLGIMRDPDRGCYPYVTGASVLPPAALLHPGSRVVGVAKPYITLVGDGPLPTECSDDDAARLRNLGGEFGATTGRPRRCAWCDVPALRYAVRATGATCLAVTKCDLLPAIGEVPVCVRYDGYDERRGYPTALEVRAIRPVYERWSAHVPAEDFARRLAAAVGVPLVMVGTGPARGQVRSFPAA